MHGIHEFHIRQDGIPHETIVDHGRGTYQVVEGILSLVRVHGAEFEHPGDGYDGDGVLLGGERHHVRSAGRD